MRCDEFLKEWSSYRDGCDVELSVEAAAHGASCLACAAEMRWADEMERLLRLGLAQRAGQAQPSAGAVAQAVLAATAALEETAAPARATQRSRPPRRAGEPLRFVPLAPLSLARWAVAAVFILAVGLLGRGQPLNPTPTYADMTATAVALPSATPSATLSAHVPGTPTVLVMAPVVATPGPAR